MLLIQQQAKLENRAANVNRDPFYSQRITLIRAWMNNYSLLSAALNYLRITKIQTSTV